MAKKAGTGRWQSPGMFVLGGSVVGTVTDGRGCYFAHGCDVEWEDVNLGSHSTKDDAKNAVESWVDSHL